jgi:hypothetical protein
MTEPGTISRLLSELQGLDPPPRPAASRRRGSARPRIDGDAKARLIDASLGVIAAVRVLADVAEDVLMERRERLDTPLDAEQRAAAAETTRPRRADRDRGRVGRDREEPDQSYQHIPLSY